MTCSKLKNTGSSQPSGTRRFFAVVIVGGKFIPKVRQFNTYQEKSQTLQSKIDQTLLAEQTLKEQQRRFTTDRDFVERIAHEVGYAHPDETIFHFPNVPETDER